MVNLLTGDCREVLKTLADCSVHCCVTSPPYFGLRDYGCGGQIGLEPTPDEFVAALVAVFREVKRVLRDDGTCWINIGDSYASNPASGGEQSSKMTGGEHKRTPATQYKRPSGLKPKDLIGIPWRVAFALQADGWYLRQDIIWHKPNPMPESVTDRCTKAHEYIFLLSKSAKYWYDAEAIKEDTGREAGKPRQFGATKQEGTLRQDIGNTFVDDGKRNKRSVWTVATQPYSGAHFATFPPALITPCILAGCPSQCCPKCGKGWDRVTESTKTFQSGSGKSGNPIQGKKDLSARETNSTPDIRKGPCVSTRTIGHRPACDCGETTSVSGTVLDPFGGSGTTGDVSEGLGRNSILIELNPDYVMLQKKRTAQMGLFCDA